MTPATSGSIDGGWNYVYAAYAVYGLVVLGYGAMLLRRWSNARKQSPGGSR
jgi:hypothetical protein